MSDDIQNMQTITADEMSKVSHAVSCVQLCSTFAIKIETGNYAVLGVNSISQWPKPSIHRVGPTWFELGII